MSELLKDIIDKIKKWDIKRKSEDILCPYCLHNYHKVVKWIGIYPIYSCSQCHTLFNYDGKKIKTPIFVENAPEDFTIIYREKDIKKAPFLELTKEEEQSIKDLIENKEGSE
jgi:DNA-directed RNA polymerase subunit RPC12/RpoP